MTRHNIKVSETTFETLHGDKPESMTWDEYVSALHSAASGEDVAIPGVSDTAESSDTSDALALDDIRSVLREELESVPRETAEEVVRSVR